MKVVNLDNIDNIVFDGINHKDAPDYCDTYIVSADYNGVPMTENEIAELPSEFIHEQLIEHLS